MLSWRSPIPCAVAVAAIAASGCAGSAASRPHGSILAPSSSATVDSTRWPTRPSNERPIAALTPPPAGTEAPLEPSAPAGPMVVQEPYLGRELDLLAPLVPDLLSTPSPSRGLATARHLVANLARQVRSGRWSVAIRTGCPVEYDGDVFVEGRAIVLDAAGSIRGYAESPGTGDSAGIWKLYYDQAAHLRLAVFGWHSVAGQSVEGVMLFDASGRLESCVTQPDDASSTYCDTKGTALDDAIDPAVADAVRPDVVSRPQHATTIETPVAWVASRDPVREFQKCETPYAPSR